MATFELRANELSGLTGLSVRLYAEGAASILNSGGDALTEASGSDGFFTATIAETLSGWLDYAVYRSSAPIYKGKVFAVGSTWVADQTPVLEETTTPTPDSSELVALASAEPRKASGDGVSVENHSLSELIEAEKYLNARANASDKRGGVRFAKVVPGGTISRNSGQ